jgi:asparagine synthase (glutamine-hydrolysing)
VRGIRKLRPGYLLAVENGCTLIRRYWKLSFAKTSNVSEQAIQEGLLGEIRRAVGIRMPASAGPAVFLSGGMDSSTVLALSREAFSGPIRTYAYRCRSESFDESHYARLMAASVGAEHEEIEYRPDDVPLMAEIVSQMAEPFCDAGINVGTYLLGRAAGGKGSVVFTGDGGDELFGGHPVYEADKVARFVDPIPAALRRRLLSVLSRLPDPDRKKNLVVKLRRFADGLAHPEALLSDRWRVDYSLEELATVLAPGVLEGLDVGTLFDEGVARKQEADGPDLLSRTLYGDYENLVDFYLRRNDLIRHFGIETRYPLLDLRLVEYCAAIPSKLKIKDWFKPKYVLHRAMEGVLPREIVHRKNKLGHSVPLKNWLRDDTRVREFVLDHISEPTILRRGIVRPEFVARQVEEHMSRRRNNSHRLWALAVLEMWMRAHLDP